MRQSLTSRSVAGWGLGPQARVRAAIHKVPVTSQEQRAELRTAAEPRGAGLHVSPLDKGGLSPGRTTARPGADPNSEGFIHGDATLGRPRGTARPGPRAPAAPQTRLGEHHAARSPHAPAPQTHPPPLRSDSGVSAAWMGIWAAAGPRDLRWRVSRFRAGSDRPRATADVRAPPCAPAGADCARSSRTRGAVQILSGRLSPAWALLSS